LFGTPWPACPPSSQPWLYKLHKVVYPCSTNLSWFHEGTFGNITRLGLLKSTAICWQAISEFHYCLSHWEADGEAVHSSDNLVFTSQFSHCILNSSCWQSSQVWMWMHHCNIFSWTVNCNEQHKCVTKLSLLTCDFSITNNQINFRIYNTQVFSYHCNESMNLNFQHQKIKSVTDKISVLH
jgi:hypothetical protein